MVNSRINGNVPFEIMYEDHAVSWNPYYEIYMDEESKPLRFRLRARIMRKALCKEWKDISVSLFGETTRQYNEIPVLIPKHLQYIEEKKEKTFDLLSIPRPSVDCYMETVPLKQEETTLAPDESVFDDDIFNDTSFERSSYDADMNSDGITYFELPGKWTFPEVENGNQRFREMMIDIQDFTLPVAYRYYAVPGNSTNVYLTAKLEETDVHQILACQADLYVRDVMIGSCMLRPKSAASQYRISLGRDDELYAAKKQIQNQQYVKKQGKAKKKVYEYRITLQNRKSQGVTIQAADQIPISDDSRIEVIQEELSGGIYNSETGEVTWNVSVGPKSSVDFILRYSVVYSPVK